jgi:tRNA(Ile)-lysidine synthase
MNIVRGSGIEGIKGIGSKYNNIIRPLLNITRAEIEEYCHENNLTPMIDKTNFETIYTRNKMRNSIIPMLKEINPEVLNSITRLGNILTEEDEFISRYIDKIYNDIVIKEKNIELNKVKFLELHRGAQRRVLRKAILEFKGNLIDISYKSIENAIDSIISSFQMQFK